jgi:hypothetical protein
VGSAAAAAGAVRPSSLNLVSITIKGTNDGPSRRVTEIQSVQFSKDCIRDYIRIIHGHDGMIVKEAAGAGGNWRR